MARPLEPYLERYGKETEAVSSQIPKTLFLTVREGRPGHIPIAKAAITRFAFFCAAGWINAQAELDEQKQQEMLSKLEERVELEVKRLVGAKINLDAEDLSHFESTLHEEKLAAEKERMEKCQEAQLKIQRQSW